MAGLGVSVHCDLDPCLFLGDNELSGLYDGGYVEYDIVSTEHHCNEKTFLGGTY